MKKTFFSLLLIITILTSCKDGIFYQHSASTGGPWSYETPLVYTFDVSSTTDAYDLLLQLRHDADFAYQNIYLKIQTKYPSMQEVEDVISVDLTDNMGGWLGKCSGSMCKVDIVLQQRFRFKEEGKHTISIYQHSREETLEGINTGVLTLKTHATEE